MGQQHVNCKLYTLQGLEVWINLWMLTDFTIVPYYTRSFPCCHNLMRRGHVQTPQKILMLFLTFRDFISKYGGVWQVCAEYLSGHRDNRVTDKQIFATEMWSAQPFWFHATDISGCQCCLATGNANAESLSVNRFRICIIVSTAHKLIWVCN